MNIKRIVLSLALVVMALSAGAQIFYRVEGNGLDKPSYLFGTHHLAPIWVIDSVGARGALDDCSQVVGEIDMTADKIVIASKMQMHMMAPTDSTLSKVLGVQNIEKYSPVFSQFSPIPGLQLSMLDAMKPMAVNTMMMAGLVSKQMPGFDAEQQLDTYFQKTGKAAGKKIIALEDVDLQASFLFDSVSIADQAKALLATFENPDHAAEGAEQLNAAYLSRDLDALFALTKAEEADGNTFELLLNRRNENWLPQLDAIMKDGPTFIAVGALHLAGPDGLVARLKKLGYTVTPLK